MGRPKDATVDARQSKCKRIPNAYLAYLHAHYSNVYSVSLPCRCIAEIGAQLQTRVSEFAMLYDRNGKIWMCVLHMWIV